MGALIIAAIGLAAVPAAATAWISTMTLGLCVAYWHGSPEIDPKLAVTIIGVAAIAILGVGRLTRWTFDQLQEMARVRTQAESVRLLLRDRFPVLDHLVASAPAGIRDIYGNARGLVGGDRWRQDTRR